MSNNVFDKIGDIKNNVNRSTFDWSHDNNFSTGLGRIIPVFCELCPPNSALRIKPEFGLQFMPMMFPVQTKMKSYLSFYRVPLRTLWKDYMNFISSPQDTTYEPPYINFPADSFNADGALSISSLADYFGIPVTTSQPSVTVSYPKVQAEHSALLLFENYYLTGNGNLRQTTNLANFVAGHTLDVEALESSTSQQSSVILDGKHYAGGVQSPGVWFPNNSLYISPAETLGVAASDVPLKQLIIRTARLHFRFEGQFAGTFYNTLNSDRQSIALAAVINPTTAITGLDGVTLNDWNIYNIGYPINIVYTPSNQINERVLEFDIQVTVPFYFDNGDGSTNPMATAQTSLGLFFKNKTQYFRLIQDQDTSRWTYAFDYQQIASDSFVAMADVTSASGLTVPITREACPYVNQGGLSQSTLKISAYPFRAYEAIYNAYTRNTRNNPFIVDGKPVYNRWITNNDGGADSTTPLTLRRANWASDMYVTALTAPQQGTAPLVGITTYTEQTALENGHVETKVKTALVDEDGNKYAVNFESNDEELKGVTYTQLNSDTPVRPVSNLYDLVTSGISINDFRNVNAYQRYLELNQFRGFKYKDIVEGRFDVQVRYDELDMPEYLGGITRDVIVNPVTQTVETSDSGTYQGALGSQSGLAGVRGSTDQTISCFCDEESLVIGLLSVVPMPIYTQVLPKHFLYRERLDSYNPEFDHIGYQPIGLSELCPVLDFVSNGKNTNATFGYQRPWYEYCQKLDTAHGLFRTDLRNFLINRVFDAIPQLGADFTTVDERDVNNVFSVTETTDKIYGQIHFDISAKLPISRVVVPKLE